MLHRSFDQLKELGNEIVYIDDKGMEERSGAVIKTDVDYENRIAFVYVKSFYEEENKYTDYFPNGQPFKYRDIIVFDDRPESEHGWHKDPALANYGRYLDKDN